jgi:hypothetical protein
VLLLPRLHRRAQQLGVFEAEMQRKFSELEAECLVDAKIEGGFPPAARLLWGTHTHGQFLPKTMAIPQSNSFDVPAIPATLSWENHPLATDTNRLLVL